MAFVARVEREQLRQREGSRRVEGGNMALPDIDTVLSWRGRTIVDETGEKIGNFEEIYLDAETDRPEWAAVKPGLFGRGHLLVPLNEAQEQDEETLRVPFPKAHIENAPDVDADAELSQEEEARLYAHYGIAYSQEASQTGLPQDERQETASGTPPEPGQQRETVSTGGETQRGGPASPGRDSKQATGREQEPTVTEAAGESERGQSRVGERSATVGAGGEDAPTHPNSGTGAPAEQEIESLDVEQKPRERVRLKKYLVTEEVTKTVPVQREEVRVERERVEGEEDR